jgi:hypothetical protein
LPVQPSTYEARPEQRVHQTPLLGVTGKLTCLSRYIKELADRLNTLESQIHHPPNTHNFDFGALGDQAFPDTQSPPQFKRQRTHSMAEGLQDTLGRPNWSAHDRGETHGLPVLSEQEASLNGNRRTSFGEMSLGGSLITGLNEETLKAYVVSWPVIRTALTIAQVLQRHPPDATSLTSQRVTAEPSHQLSC